MRIKIEHFDVKQIAESGQCFRMNQREDGTFQVLAGENHLIVRQESQDHATFFCSPQEAAEVWRPYFDLDQEYGVLFSKIMAGEDRFLKEAAQYGSGLRILRQDPFEILISFLISQNKNIGAIKKSVEALCHLYGEKRTAVGPEGETIVYYGFPSPGAVAHASTEALRKTGIGYRDVYVKEAAAAVVEGRIDLDALMLLPGEEAVRQLKQLPGVGDKVANCVALFGLHCLSGCPVDVWIERVLQDEYNGTFDWTKYPGSEGVVQQYMFYYQRSKKRK